MRTRPISLVVALAAVLACSYVLLAQTPGGNRIFRANGSHTCPPVPGNTEDIPLPHIKMWYP